MAILGAILLILALVLGVKLLLWIGAVVLLVGLVGLLYSRSSGGRYYY